MPMMMPPAFPGGLGWALMSQFAGPSWRIKMILHLEGSKGVTGDC